jgi:hypothetical protein
VPTEINTLTTKMRTLKQHDINTDVFTLQSLLARHGFGPGKIDGHFGRLTDQAVREFQLANVDHDGEPLEVDGIVGPLTWGALQAATRPSIYDTDDQRKMDSFSFHPLIEHLKDSRLDFHTDRILVLDQAVRMRGTKEIPDGSNWGDGVTEILKFYNQPAAPWCGFFVSYCYQKAMHRPLLDNADGHGHVLTMWKATAGTKVRFLAEEHRPAPGDIFIMLYRNAAGRLTGNGHTGFVLKTARDHFSTIEGNSGNRVAIRRRSYDQKTLQGFISPYPDAHKRRLIRNGTASITSAQPDPTGPDKKTLGLVTNLWHKSGA